MPTLSPTYDIHKSYDDNYAEGPFYEGDLPASPIGAPGYRLLDFPLYAPIGVPAGPLLNARWLALYAKLGFDAPVYKTVRSGPRECHPAPNCMVLKTPGSLTPDRFDEQLTAQAADADNPDTVSITNSFGMPSKTPDTWMADMEQAAAACGNGQVFIASAVGTPQPGDGPKELASDFARTAAMTREAGAQIVEINLSCPNVASSEGSLFTDPEAARLMVRETATALSGTPLFIKLGYFIDERVQDEVVAACAPFVQGIAGINTLSFEVIDENGEQALPGAGRLRSGICGDAIRDCGLTQARRLAALRTRQRYDFALVGVGGVMTPAHVNDYLMAGVDLVMSATGAMWNPHLARQWREQQAAD